MPLLVVWEVWVGVWMRFPHAFLAFAWLLLFVVPPRLLGTARAHSVVLQIFSRGFFVSFRGDSRPFLCLLLLQGDRNDPFGSYMSRGWTLGTGF